MHAAKCETTLTRLKRLEMSPTEQSKTSGKKKEPEQRLKRFLSSDEAAVVEEFIWRSLFPFASRAKYFFSFFRSFIP